MSAGNQATAAASGADAVIAQGADSGGHTGIVPTFALVPQAVDAAGNNHAPRMLMRDVDNLRNFFGHYAPALLATQYGPEIWALYAGGLLAPDTQLTGRYEPKAGEVDLSGVLREIEDARREEAERLLRMR